MTSCTWTLSFSPLHPTTCHLLSSFLSFSIISPSTSTGLLSPPSCPLSCALSSLLCPCLPPVSMVVADSDFASKMKNRQMGSTGGMNITKSTSISGDMCNLEKTDGSQSDTAVGTVGTDDKKRRSSIGAKMQAMVGMSRKSRSTSQLSQTGRTAVELETCWCVMSICRVLSWMLSSNAAALSSPVPSFSPTFFLI